MSRPLSELSLDQQYSSSADSESFEHYYDTYSTLVPTSAGPGSDFYTSENLYLWQDVDGIYHWADASAARSDSCLGYSSPSYYVSALSSEAIPPSNYCGYRLGDLEDPSQPATAQENSYIFHLAQQFRNGSARPQLQDHRSSIARASDNFLAQASSIFSDGHSSLRRGTTLDYRPSIPHPSSSQRDPRPPSRKRSRESLDEASYHVKDGDNAHLSSLPTATDACRLPQPHTTTMPSQGLPSFSVRLPHLGDATTSLNADSHTREHESRLRPEERCAIPVPKSMSNKRVHRSTEELVRQESTILSMPTTTWSIPDDQVMKEAKKPGEQKKQALACLFCRERKIACGRPPAHNPDQTCNQCARRRIKCEYPTESRRGQHKRRRKPMEGEPTSQSAVRTNSTSSVASTTTASSSTKLTTTTPPA
ncbi:hypothetical protein J3R82DRAFT_2351 [Butyriboletus roseoflavus]|nr:hypothetical protein J3R82DRAFT_2351 [Butyriboletus roseoflavus]